MTLIHYFQNTRTAELLRAVNSQKGYLFFDISVTNCGMSIFIKCTDQYKEINRNTWNGYDFIIENDYTTEYYILNVLKERLADPEANLKPTQILRIKNLLKN
jgi:hypothetical protein